MPTITSYSPDSTVDDSTLDSHDGETVNSDRWWLSILHHPDSRRVGERVCLADLTSGLPVALSRVKPAFQGADGRPRALEHPRLSRTPVWLQAGSDTLSVWTTRADLRVSVQLQPFKGRRDFAMREVAERGLFIGLGGCILLCLHAHALDLQTLAAHGMYGVSAAIATIHETVTRVAPLSTPVLIRGESGVGKELVARALHRRSPRSEHPWVAVNLAAVPAATAASALFGHGRGAFTGANQARAGYFAQADGGSLFLDEIGETAGDIQPQLLRALENHEIQPVGGSSRTVDVRIIAATDADLDAMMTAGRFRRALLHRLQTTIIDVPPLRARPADIPVLLHHFLRLHLSEHGASGLLSTDRPMRKQRAWLRLSVVARLMSYNFPGNVRELRNIAARMALECHDREHASLPSDIKDALEHVSDSARTTRLGAEPDKVGTSLRRASANADVDAHLIVSTLREHRWNITRSARALGVCRNTLIARMRALPNVRLASELTREDILSAQERVGTDIEHLVDELQVSPHGLRLRLRDLGLRPASSR